MSLTVNEITERQRDRDQARAALHDYKVKAHKTALDGFDGCMACGGAGEDYYGDKCLGEHIRTPTPLQIALNITTLACIPDSSGRVCPAATTPPLRWFEEHATPENRADLSILVAVEIDADAALQREVKGWTVGPGKLVKVHRKARTKDPAAVGVQGVVFWVQANAYGTLKIGLIDAQGAKHWTTFDSVSCVDSADHAIPQSAPATKGPATVITGKLLRESDKAWHVESADGTRDWYPKSQCTAEPRSAFDENIAVTLPLWLAKKKGLAG